MAKIRVEDFGQGEGWSFMAAGIAVERCSFLQFTPGPNATRGFRSGDYELVKIVEGKPSYKKAREGLGSMELLLVAASYLCTHNPSVSPFTLIFFALLIFFVSYHT